MSTAPHTQPSVSIILPTLNGMPILKRCIEGLQAQEYDGPVEIIHIDSGSTDDTITYLAEHHIETTSITQAAFHHGRTRNEAATRAQHDILVFISQDVVPLSSNWLARLVAPFSDPDVGAAYGKQVPSEDITPVRRYALEFLYSNEYEVRALSPDTPRSLALYRFSNANAAIRADLCRQLRFSETVLICEDQGMCRDILEAGYKVVYTPDAAVLHGHNRTLFGEFCWALENGISLKRLGILGDPAMGSELTYGLQRIQREWRHFTSNGRYGAALQGFLISLIRWLGVQLGKREHLVPDSILRKVSPHWKAKNIKS